MLGARRIPLERTCRRGVQNDVPERTVEIEGENFTIDAIAQVSPGDDSERAEAHDFSRKGVWR